LETPWHSLETILSFDLPLSSSFISNIIQESESLE
jgi:hypothetical protein